MMFSSSSFRSSIRANNRACFILLQSNPPFSLERNLSIISEFSINSSPKYCRDISLSPCSISLKYLVARILASLSYFIFIILILYQCSLMRSLSTSMFIAFAISSRVTSTLLFLLLNSSSVSSLPSIYQALLPLGYSQAGPSRR